MNILIYGDTETCAALRHEVPLAIGDPFLYLEAERRRAVVTSPLEEARIASQAPDLELMMVADLGEDELLQRGCSRLEIEQELCVRAARALGIGSAVVPPEFPVALADRLRAAGMRIEPDGAPFAQRRRNKSAAELAGIRRAAAVALDAVAAAATMLREAQADGGVLRHSGEELTCEDIRARVRGLCANAGASAPGDIIVRAAGPGAALGHEPGSGPLPADVPIEIDVWLRDDASGCWADMTRTFVCGEISDSVAALHGLVLEAHERACAGVKPGAECAEVYGLACEPFEAAGYATKRTKPTGETLREGFYYELGHGVGLAVHEPPNLGPTDRDRLLLGDAIALEPGLVSPGIGGTRVEDTIVVTEDGGERLTGSYPYDLAP